MVAVTPTDARVFTLDASKHVRLFGRLLGRLALGVLLALSAFQYWWWSSLSPSYPHNGLACAIALVGLLLWLAGAAWLASRIVSSRYRLWLGSSWVGADSGGSRRERVDREELAHVCEGAFGLVLVKHRGRPLRIPRSLDGYQVVRERLLAWLPLTPRHSPHFRSWLGLARKLAILTLSLFVALAGALLLALLNVLLQLALQLGLS